MRRRPSSSGVRVDLVVVHVRHERVWRAVGRARWLAGRGRVEHASEDRRAGGGLGARAWANSWLCGREWVGSVSDCLEGACEARRRGEREFAEDKRGARARTTWQLTRLAQDGWISSLLAGKASHGTPALASAAARAC